MKIPAADTPSTTNATEENDQMKERSQKHTLRAKILKVRRRAAVAVPTERSGTKGSEAAPGRNLRSVHLARVSEASDNKGDSFHVDQLFGTEFG